MSSLVINDLTLLFGDSGGIPRFTYMVNGIDKASDPDYVLTYDDGNGNWEIVFLQSGTLKFSGGDISDVDMFLVGSGANGTDGENIYQNYWNYATGGTGGNGGECKTIPSVEVSKRTAYSITIGSEGGSTTGFGYTAIGGSDTWSGSESDPRLEGVIGAYSNGSSYQTGGSNRAAGNGTGGANATLAYGDDNTAYNPGRRYGASGAGGGSSVLRSYSGGYTQYTNLGPGSGAETGSGSGGTATNGSGVDGNPGLPNTGSGGGGGGAGENACGNGGTGGSGIMMLRNHRAA